jgi:hypothetical protein
MLQATSALPGVIVSTTLASTNATTVYTSPIDGCYTQLRQATVANTSAARVSVGVGIAKAQQATHVVVPASFALDAGDTCPLSDFLDGHLLGPGDAVVMTAGTAGAIDVVVSGVVWS